MARQLTDRQWIERSIVTKYRKKLWAPFLTAINQYQLIHPGDHIAVCISGGKDSMCMAALFQILKVHSDIPFEVTYLIMDPGYNAANRKKIEENAQRMELPYVVYETSIFDVTQSECKKACYLCARMRRGHLYAKAKELGCNKIALGHHMNDAIETALMSMFYSSKLETMAPIARSDNFEGMEMIRPLYRIKEEDIISWANYNHFRFIQCACRFTEMAENDMASSKRKETKELIAQLKKTNPLIESNIFNALHAVAIKCFPGVVVSGHHYTINDFYSNLDEDIPNPYRQ